MSEVTVVDNSGEVAKFSDGTELLRQRPERNTNNPNPRVQAVYKGNLSFQVFMRLLAKGSTVDVIIERLNDPNLKTSDEGTVGSVQAPPVTFEHKKGASWKFHAGKLIVKDGVFTFAFTTPVIIPDGEYEVVKFVKPVGEQLTALEIQLV
jgi:hypothetical protein